MSDELFHTILVPGLGCSARLYDAVLPDVWAHGAVTVADTRRDETTAAIAERLLASAPERFALVGLSMGGYIAFEVMRQAPERVRALALISTSARPDTPEQLAGREVQQRLVGEGKFNQLVEAAFPLLVAAENQGRPELADFWRQMAREVGPEAFSRQLRAIAARADSRPLLSTITCPSAVIHGTADRLIPVENGAEIAASIPGVVATFLDGVGHLAPVEAPEALRAALSAWLERAADAP
jgi:pimeloyl-ACP methyl ester carboxylesterase